MCIALCPNSSLHCLPVYLSFALSSLFLVTGRFDFANESVRQRPDTEDTVKRHSRLMKQIISSLQFFSMFSHL